MVQTTLTAKQFLYWLEKMDLSYERAAQLLEVSIRVIEGYACGLIKIPSSKVATCQTLLRFKSEREKQESMMKERNASCQY